jgi:hypothetical protein
LLCVVGCSSEKPVTAPKLDPAAAAELAMQEYDSDSDGKISKAEAKKTAMDPKKGWDSDGDGAISADEVQARLERYEALKAGIQTLTCTVRFRGDFLPDAEILFDPEPFLGETAVMAEGTTDGYGQAEITAPSISEQDPTLQGIRCGLYRVRITHPKLDIPKKYNEDTTLFFELSPFDNVLMPTFELR